VCDMGLFLLDGQVQTYGAAMDAIRAYESFLHSEERSTAVGLNRTHEGLEMELRPVETLSVELLNGNSETRDCFTYSDDVQIRVSYRTQEPLRSPSLLARIIRSDGTTCCEIRTRNDEVWLPDLEASGYISFFLEPLQLASGAYMIEVRLQDTADVAPLGVGQSDWFLVSGPGATVVYEFGGIYVPKVRWGFASSRQPADEDGLLPCVEGEGK